MVVDAMRHEGLSMADLAVKFGVELTGDPFIDDEQIRHAKAAFETGDAEPPPPSRKHRSEQPRPAKRPSNRVKNDDEAAVVTRLKTVTPQERKAAAALRHVVCLLAREAALRTNRIPQLIADITTILEQTIQAAAADAGTSGRGGTTAENSGAPDGETTVSFIPLPTIDTRTALTPVMEATHKSADAWAADPDNLIELDEELLRSIAHAAHRSLNQLEGFVAPPEYVVSKKALAARAKALAAAKEKLRRAAEKAARREQEELEKNERKRQEQMQLKAARGQGVEDTDLAHASDIAGVVAGPVPLLSVPLFESALRVWSVIVSAPKIVKVSQMPFATFVTALKDNTSQGTIMRDVARGLIEGAGGGDIALDGRHASKSWLAGCLAFMSSRMDAIIDAAAAALSNAKRKPGKKKSTSAGTVKRARHHDTTSTSTTSSSDEDVSASDSSDEDDEDEEEEASQGDDEVAVVAEEAVAAEEAVSVVRKPRPETPMQAARRKAAETLAPLRQLVDKYTPSRACSWINLDVTERVAVLEFLTLTLLDTPSFAAHAAEIDERSRQDYASYEAKVKHLREEADKNKRALRAEQREAEAGIGAGKPPRRGTGKSASPQPETPASAAPPSASPTTAETPPAPAPVAAASSSVTASSPKLRTPEEYQAKLRAIDEKTELAVEHAFLAYRAKLEKEDRGLRIRPLGRDRFKRLYWYFPLERRLLVQCVPGVTLNVPSTPPVDAHYETPDLATPATPRLIDDDDDPRPRGAAGAAAIGETPEELGLRTDDVVPNMSWFFVPARELERFIESLDPRGLREGPLRAAVQQLLPHIRACEEASNVTGRMTRHSQRNAGFFNRLREASWW